MAMGSVPSRLRSDKVVSNLEIPNFEGTGTANTSDIKKKISATRPARERIFELYMI